MKVVRLEHTLLSTCFSYNRSLIRIRISYCVDRKPGTMFSGKGKKRPLSDTVTSSFLDEFGADRCDNELPSFLFNMATSKDNSLFKTPEINRNASKVSNQSTPLSMMPTEKANSKTPSPGCMTSTPKRVQSEEINLSELLQEEFGRNPRVASPKGKKHINLGAPFGDSFLQNQSSILNPDNVRPVGTYTISLLEEEYDKLYGLIKEGREKNMQAVSNVIQAMKDRVRHL